MPKCKGCGAEIIWTKTEKGKNMPLDAKPVNFWVIECEGEKIIDYNLIQGHKSLWETCPKAGEFRKNAKANNKNL